MLVTEELWFLLISIVFLDIMDVDGNRNYLVFNIHQIAFLYVLHNKEKSYTLRNKGTKAVTVAVPFQKEQFCTY